LWGKGDRQKPHRREHGTAIANNSAMPRHASHTPAVVLTTLAALGRRTAWLQHAIERRRAGEAAFQRHRGSPGPPGSQVAMGDPRAAVVGPPDVPGVPQGHPLHDPHGWATCRNDALLTQAKLVRYERWLRFWAKRGRYAGGTELVRADDSTSRRP
jgi:hypothetical protein